MPIRALGLKLIMCFEKIVHIKKSLGKAVAEKKLQ